MENNFIADRVALHQVLWYIAGTWICTLKHLVFLASPKSINIYLYRRILEKNKRRTLEDNISKTIMVRKHLPHFILPDSHCGGLCLSNLLRNSNRCPSTVPTSVIVLIRRKYVIAWFTHLWSYSMSKSSCVVTGTKANAILLLWAKGKTLQSLGISRF